MSGISTRNEVGYHTALTEPLPCMGTESSDFVTFMKLAGKKKHQKIQKQNIYSLFGTHIENAHIKWATSWENLFVPYANNKGADQPAHLRSLTSTFVARCLDSIIPLVAIAKISRP